MRIEVLIVVIWLFSLNAFAQNIQSPDGKLLLAFGLTSEGEPTHQLSFKGKQVLQTSRLGIELKDQPALT
ncbi:MAG: glycoside hydrolase family 97 N-terminal domain-containing protein, partial [Pyrinomonadaceae bacterium]|nr:glycoside hydrolase family 97 N-terminal domain-containing protein [Pyrinomonadaceae bacterium]